MNTDFSFKHAYESLPVNKQAELREKVQTALNLRTYAFYARMRGYMLKS